MVLWRLQVSFYQSVILWSWVRILSRLRNNKWNINQWIFFWFSLKLSKIDQSILSLRLLLEIHLVEDLRNFSLSILRFWFQRLLLNNFFLKEPWKVLNSRRFINWAFWRLWLWIFLITKQVSRARFHIKVQLLWLHTLSKRRLLRLERKRWTLHPKSSEFLINLRLEKRGCHFIHIPDIGLFLITAVVKELLEILVHLLRPLDWPTNRRCRVKLIPQGSWTHHSYVLWTHWSRVLLHQPRGFLDLILRNVENLAVGV